MAAAENLNEVWMNALIKSLMFIFHQTQSNHRFHPSIIPNTDPLPPHPDIFAKQ